MLTPCEFPDDYDLGDILEAAKAHNKSLFNRCNPAHRLLKECVAKDPQWAVEKMLYLENFITNTLKKG